MIRRTDERDSAPHRTPRSPARSAGGSSSSATPTDSGGRGGFGSGSGTTPGSRSRSPSPRELPAEEGTSRAGLLSEFLHPELIPLPREGRGVGNPAEMGESLEAVLRRWGGAPLPGWRRRLPEGVAGLLASFGRVARLLGELAGAGLVVSRLHPRWLRVGEDGRIRLLAAALLDEHDADLEPAEFAPYLAPELLLSGERIAPSGESGGVYSLSAILVHCLAGTAPWSGRSEAEVADRLLSGIPPAPIPEAKDVPRGVAPLLADALSLDPRQRPARFRGFAAALEAASRGQRPRSRAAHLRGTPGPRGLVVRALVVAVLLVGVVTGLRQNASVRDRAELLTRLDSAVLARPYPIHGEDSPTHRAGGQVLRDATDDAARWPHDPEVLVALGWTELRAGDVPSALHHFRTARLWGPRSAAAWISLGIARVEAGDPAGRLDVERGLALPALSPRARMLQGAGELYLRRFRAAMQTFTHCLVRDGESAETRLHLALAAHHAGEDETADRALEAAIAQRPHDVWTQWLLAERFARSGDTAIAIARIQADAPQWIDVPALVLRGAVLLRRLGEEERALEWWERAHPNEERPFDGSEIRWNERGLLTVRGRTVLPETLAPPVSEPAPAAPPE